MSLRVLGRQRQRASELKTQLLQESGFSPPPVSEAPPTPEEEERDATNPGEALEVYFQNLMESQLNFEEPVAKDGADKGVAEAATKSAVDQEADALFETLRKRAESLKKETGSDSDSEP